MIKAIGSVRSPFKQKFATPRQSGLTPSALSVIEFDKNFVHGESFDGLSDYSHIWVHFLFHQNEQTQLKAKITPPRLNGQKVGVFASRSPHRPNPLGQSLVKLMQVDAPNLKLTVSGLDVIDKTPVVDIKPYLSIYDMTLSQHPDWIDKDQQNKIDITWSSKAKNLQKKLKTDQLRLINELLTLDHRNLEDKNKNDSTKIHKTRLYNFDLHFQYKGQTSHIVDIIML